MYISHRYFAPGRTVVISSPSTYRDVQQELIVEIHRNAIWPVVVNIDNVISKTTKTHFSDRDTSYIILIPDGNFLKFVAKFKWLAEIHVRNFRIPWNSEARFVVAGANEFSISQLYAIFDLLSKFRIYNCIIISREHYLTGKKYRRQKRLNDEDTGMKFVVYTWFPYHSPNRCTNVNVLTILDRWVISAQGHFNKNTDLFPLKIRNSLNRCPMKAFVEEADIIFSTKYDTYKDSNGNVVMDVVGQELTLLMFVLQKMNMTFVLANTQDLFGKNSYFFADLAMAMISKKIYIALGNFLQHYMKERLLEVTKTHSMVNIRWYVPCSIKLPRWSSFFRILSGEMWLVLIISIVIVVISTTLVARYSCTSECQGFR
jgi:hypothetical protein